MNNILFSAHVLKSYWNNDADENYVYNIFKDFLANEYLDLIKKDIKNNPNLNDYTSVIIELYSPFYSKFYIDDKLHNRLIYLMDMKLFSSKTIDINLYNYAIFTNVNYVSFLKSKNERFKDLLINLCNKWKEDSLIFFPEYISKEEGDLE